MGAGALGGAPIYKDRRGSRQGRTFCHSRNEAAADFGDAFEANIALPIDFFEGAFGMSAPVCRARTESSDVSFAFKTVTSPLGDLRLVANGSKLCAILWKVEQPGRVVLGPWTESVNDAALLEAERQLAEYFSGTRKVFELDLDPKGTPFQRRVWNALLKIPFGETRTYAAMGQDLGSPNAARAVGAANGRNPIAIVIPCHRLVGTSGGLHGFAGGLEAKEHLLGLESEAFRLRAAQGRKTFVPASGHTPASWVTRPAPPGGSQFSRAPRRHP